MKQQYNNPILQAIETSYRGFRFRSRQEARWAIFFDALEVPWEYEKEGYELPSGRYLPDFWLPTLDCFFEVKGAEPTEMELTKAAELSNLSKKLVAIANGQTKTEPLRFSTVHIEWPVKEFNIQIFAGNASSVWPSIAHNFSMWNWVLDTDLPPFIKSMHQELILPTNNLERRREILIQCDQEYYKNKYMKEHPRYRYGRHVPKVYFTSNPITKICFALEPEDEPSEVSKAYEAACSARFEHRR